MPKPRKSQEMITWKARKRQERRRQALRHVRLVAQDIATLVLLIAVSIGMVALVAAYIL